MNLAVIPARGGSKRIPRKNIKDFHGKPMIAWSIEAAQASGSFDRIIVSTDDPEIAGVAKRFGAEVPFVRPQSLSNDHAGTTEVIAHSVGWARETGLNPTAVCCIYATAPLVQGADLREAFSKLSTGEWQYVFSATTFGYPIFRSFERTPGGGVKMFYPEHFDTRSQDLPEAFHDAGQFYWGLPDAWTGGKRIFEAWSTVVLLPRWRVQDIDTDEDWERAERLAQLISQTSTL